MHTSLSVEEIIRNDPVRWNILSQVRSLQLPDCWVGAGFVRNAVWGYLHDRTPSPPSSYVDVIWFDIDRASVTEDLKIEQGLRKLNPLIEWSVKNQARMHLRNNDAPYTSSFDAMRYWPETATAVAVRRREQDSCEVICPFGLDDLFELVLRPTANFVERKRSIYQNRLLEKDWLNKWPKLIILES